MKLGILIGVVATLLVLTATAYTIVVSGCIYPGADEPIPPLERWAAKTSLHNYAEKIPKKNAPIPVNDENLQAGATLYLNHCASCHGFADKEMTSTAEGLYKKPPIIARDDWSKDDDNLLYWFVDHGVKLTGMPAYHTTLKENEMWQIVMFIKRMRTLPPKTDAYWKNAKAQVF